MKSETQMREMLDKLDAIAAHDWDENKQEFIRCPICDGASFECSCDEGLRWVLKDDSKEPVSSYPLA